MKIAIIMFSRGNGGIEQAFIDYCESLRDLGHQVTAIICPKAAVASALSALSIPYVCIGNWGEWDLVSAYRLRRFLLQSSPDIIIAGSNRSLMLAKHAIKGRIPLIGVAHNYSTSRLRHADGVFAITHDLITQLLRQGINEHRIFHIPNMIRCRELPQRIKRNNPPVIGSMGRFVAKKGFDVYIDALAILRARGYRFNAILGGSGEELKRLKKHAADTGVDNVLTFPGWIENKKEFYSHIDIFCLPSLHEPFGIVLLEAFTHGTPVIATDSEGPRDIITPNYDALMVEKGNAEALASAMMQLLDSQELADNLAANAFAKTKTAYAMEIIAKRIERACLTIIDRWKK